MPEFHVASSASTLNEWWKFWRATYPGCVCGVRVEQDAIDMTTFGDHERVVLHTPRPVVDVNPKCQHHARPGDRARQLLGKTPREVILDDLKMSEEKIAELFADQSPRDDEPDTISDVDTEWDRKYDCCDDPSPRVHDRTGRFFCGSCRQWLDQPRGDSNAQGDATDATPVDQTGDDATPD